MTTEQLCDIADLRCDVRRLTAELKDSKRAVTAERATTAQQATTIQQLHQQLQQQQLAIANHQRAAQQQLRQQGAQQQQLQAAQQQQQAAQQQQQDAQLQLDDTQQQLGQVQQQLQAVQQQLTQEMAYKARVVTALVKETTEKGATISEQDLQLKALRNAELCVLCLAVNRDVVLLECGHICCCAQCADGLRNRFGCPNCNEPVLNVMGVRL